MQDVLAAWHVFQSFDEDHSGLLDSEEYHTAVAELWRTQHNKLPLPDSVLPTPRSARAGIRNKMDSVDEEIELLEPEENDAIDFEEFLTWYAACIHHGSLHSQVQVCIDLADELNVHHDYVVHVKECFDAGDPEGCGFLDETHFPDAMRKLLRVPMHCEIPPIRTLNLWKQLEVLDASQQGKVTFKTFLMWWLRYFDEDETERDLPFAAFYGLVRRFRHYQRRQPVGWRESCDHVVEPAAEDWSAEHNFHLAFTGPGSLSRSSTPRGSEIQPMIKSMCLVASGEFSHSFDSPVRTSGEFAGFF